jgi:imidazolonepropionase-like amidohydrolase
MRAQTRPSRLHWVFLAVVLSVIAGNAVAQSGDLAIVHVTVIDPVAGGPQPDMTVVVRGQGIVSVSRAKETKVPANGQIVDGTGKYLIPALWDMHTHFRDADRDMKMYVASGVLGIRDMGGAAATVFPMREEIAKGQRLGPRIFASGAIVDGPDSFSNPEFTVSVQTMEEAREAVRTHKKEGADFIKVYDGLPREAYFAIVDEAKRQELPVAGHLPSAIGVREASNAGQRTIEHGMPLAAGSTIEDEYIKWRVDKSVFDEALQTKNFALIPAKIARNETAMLDHFQQPRADEIYKLLAKNGTFLTPTMVTERSLTFIDDLAKTPDPRMEFVTVDEKKWWKPENGMLTKYRTPEYIAMRKRQYAKTMEQILRARGMGVRFLAGTDITIPYTYPGFSLHDELKLFVEAGMTPLQALETATTNPALLLGLSKTWGRVREGYVANLVLLNADPLANIENTQKIDAVIVNGQLLNRVRLDKLLQEARVKE